MVGTHLDSPRFLTDAVFGGQVKRDELKLKSIKTPFRAVRMVAEKGQADAVVLDGTQYRALTKRHIFEKLRLLHTSPSVPTPPVTVVSSRVKSGFGRRLGKVLVGMAKDPEGQAVLKTFKIEGFEATSQQQWAKLEARLNRL